MNNRLILVEGIPGSGKSTIAYKIKDYLESNGIRAKLYSEGDSHPADLAWNAYMTMDEYEALLKNYPEYIDVIKNYTLLEENYALVAYTKLGISPGENELIKYFEAHEVCDGKIDLDTFKSLHLKRWEQFAMNADEESVIIFECAYLQNHINELMGFHDKDFDYIMDYMLNLIKTVEKLKPKLIYLTQSSTYETISRVAKERVSPDKNKWEDWIDLVVRYVEKSLYGRKHNLKGFNGAIEFFEARKKIELAVIDKLPISKAVIDNPEYKWDDVFNKVIIALKEE